ncbi:MULTISPECIES: RNA polymerase sigma factor [unclassified Novosphingobium]|uniref:RNA polymerase sigma factor n=1 Tax=Novosphingobium TaxID=165696 RepID=UPI00180E10DB|nr:MULTISPECIES: sigma-70 family RNA polymerase sigma factor [unclassified Novosphingobium]NKJ44370.1 RNA polymerase sigma-70 factor (ECF subfamily) [Novosphingobium sp. SG720]NMN05171.1 RNA polymerase sigma-70 factor (ECF subfamily) [Novosphingobium sp. SG919]NMN87466.1 RNA polymerase sigma-70 factor (ECF subfamily) [Novosphingobium sp. SG916]
MSSSLIGWVSRHVLPHERALRTWLRTAFPGRDVDDVVQESYCRLASLSSVAHIDDPRRYFFRIARNIVLEQVRRERVVRIEAASGLAVLEGAALEQQGQGEESSPERIVAGRMALERVEALIDALPERSRAIVRMRKIDGLPQREIAARLGLSENVVENEVARGLRRVLDQLTEGERAEMPTRARRAPPVRAPRQGERP